MLINCKKYIQLSKYTRVHIFVPHYQSPWLAFFHQHWLPYLSSLRSRQQLFIVNGQMLSCDPQGAWRAKTEIIAVCISILYRMPAPTREINRVVPGVLKVRCYYGEPGRISDSSNIEIYHLWLSFSKISNGLFFTTESHVELELKVLSH